MKKLLFGLVALTIALVSFKAATKSENNSNPFDYVGKLHNQILVEAFKHEEKSTSEIPAFIETIAKSNSEFNEHFPNYNQNPEMIQGILLSGINDFQNNFRNEIKKLNISKEAKDINQRLIDYMFTRGLSQEPTSYEEFNQYVLNFENEVISNSNLSELDKQVILCGSSTARHSCSFWAQRMANENTQTTKPKRPWWNWMVIGLCDVGGAVAGAATSPAGAVTAGAAASALANTLTKEENK